MNKGIVYTAIGDSLTSGVGSLWRPGFVEIYARMSANYLQKKLKLYNISKNGAATQEIKYFLFNKNIQRLIKESGIITLAAGGNDIIDAGENYLRTGDISILETSLDDAKKNISDLVGLIYYLKNGFSEPFIIRILNLYNPYPNLYPIDLWIRNYNLFLATLQTPNTIVVDIYSEFRNTVKNPLFIDRKHPNQLGYEIMAIELYKTGYYPIANSAIPLNL